MGYIIIEAVKATNLKNKALMFSMDPFVKVTAQPSGLEARCKAHKGGGRNPRWAAKGLGQLSVRVLDGDGQLLVEAWNQNSITPPDRIGSFRVDVAMLTADAQTLTLPLDTGGELVCSARRAADAEERELERAIAASLRSSSYMPSSGGTRLGGDSGADPNASAADRRAAAAAAAERRAGDWRQGGGGGDAGKRAALAERREKDDLVGKILALYAARGQDAPIGLAASPLETLKKHHASLKGGADAAAAAARKEARARDVVSRAI